MCWQEVFFSCLVVVEVGGSIWVMVLVSGIDQFRCGVFEGFFICYGNMCIFCDVDCIIDVVLLLQWIVMCSEGVLLVQLQVLLQQVSNCVCNVLLFSVVFMCLWRFVVLQFGEVMFCGIMFLIRVFGCSCCVVMFIVCCWDYIGVVVVCSILVICCGGIVLVVIVVGLLCYVILEVCLKI